MIKKTKKGGKKGKKPSKGKKIVKNTSNNKNSDKKEGNKEEAPTLGLTKNQDGIELRNINNQQYVGDIKVGTPP